MRLKKPAKTERNLSCDCLNLLSAVLKRTDMMPSAGLSDFIERILPPRRRITQSRKGRIRSYVGREMKGTHFPSSCVREAANVRHALACRYIADCQLPI